MKRQWLPLVVASVIGVGLIGFSMLSAKREGKKPEAQVETIITLPENRLPMNRMSTPRMAREDTPAVSNKVKLVEHNESSMVKPNAVKSVKIDTPLTTVATIPDVDEFQHRVPDDDIAIPLYLAGYDGDSIMSEVKDKEEIVLKHLSNLSPTELLEAISDLDALYDKLGLSLDVDSHKLE